MRWGLFWVVLATCFACDKKAPTRKQQCEHIARARAAALEPMTREQWDGLMNYCLSLPSEYLACEAAFPDHLHEHCEKWLLLYQRRLNRFLTETDPMLPEKEP